MLTQLFPNLLASRPVKHTYPLEAPPSYHAYAHSNPDYLASVCNGCGPAGWKYDLIPDTVLGVDVSEACNIHDYEYHIGVTEEDRKQADENFYNNLIKLCHNHGAPRFLGNLLFQWRKRRINKYFRAVRRFGKSAFEGK